MDIEQEFNHILPVPIWEKDVIKNDEKWKNMILQILLLSFNFVNDSFLLNLKTLKVFIIVPVITINFIIPEEVVTYEWSKRYVS